MNTIDYLTAYVLLLSYDRWNKCEFCLFIVKMCISLNYTYDFLFLTGTIFMTNTMKLGDLMQYWGLILCWKLKKPNINRYYDSNESFRYCMRTISNIIITIWELDRICGFNRLNREALLCRFFFFFRKFICQRIG